MRHIMALAKRELVLYILSPVGYVIAFLFVGLYLTLFYSWFSSMNDANVILDYGISVIYTLAIFAIPFLTMGLLADERRSGTIEVLMTAPVGDWEVVLGKYVASVVFILALVVPSLIELFIVKMYGLPDWGPVIAAYVGLVALILLLVSMGLFFSAISKSPLVAVMLSFVVFLILLTMGLFVPETPATVETTGSVFANLLNYFYAFLRYAALGEHFASFGAGVVNTKDIAYFGTGTIFFLFLSSLAVESRKWK